MTREEIIKPENLVYKKPTLMNDNPMHYCPGCSHGVVHKLIAEVIEEMGMENSQNPKLLAGMLVELLKKSVAKYHFFHQVIVFTMLVHLNDQEAIVSINW